VSTTQSGVFMENNIFKPEDFTSLVRVSYTAVRIAEYANILINERLLDGAVRVYGNVVRNKPDCNTWLGFTSDVSVSTHQALLIDIKPIEHIFVIPKERIKISMPGMTGYKVVGVNEKELCFILEKI